MNRTLSIFCMLMGMLMGMLAATAQTAYDNEATTNEQAQAAIETLKKAAFEFRIANGSSEGPQVTTDPRFIRGCVWAFGRSTVRGGNIMEQGFCWAEHPDPKVTDHRTTEHLNQQGVIYWLRDLKPATVYYMRAYAINNEYGVGYGDVIKFVTLPKGTIMHEALHGIGVGTQGMWWNQDIRPNGVWAGDRVTEALRFWDNNTTGVLSGDDMHLWPYGCNGAHEDTHNDNLYCMMGILAQALNEDTNRGCLTSYLVETDSHQLEWKAMTADEAANDDRAAWYLTFTPDNQYYQLRNAATGWTSTKTPGYGGGGAEFYETTFDFYQTLTGMPSGVYQLRANAFQRPGETNSVYKQYAAGKPNVSAQLYIGSKG